MSTVSRKRTASQDGGTRKRSKTNQDGETCKRSKKSPLPLINRDKLYAPLNMRIKRLRALIVRRHRINKKSPVSSKKIKELKKQLQELQASSDVELLDKLLVRQLPILDPGSWGEFDSDDEEEEPAEPTSLLELWLRQLRRTKDWDHPDLFMQLLKQIRRRHLNLPRVVEHIVTELDDTFQQLVDSDDDFDDEQIPMAANIHKHITNYCRSSKPLKEMYPQLKEWAGDIHMYKRTVEGEWEQYTRKAE